MVQFRILSGKQAGVTWTARRFPVRIGRDARADLRSQDDGVWDRHLIVALKPAEGFVATTEPNALATVNGQPVESAILRNGDLLELGSLKLQFWLAETRQSAMQVREWLTWTGIAAICLGQIGLIYYLLQ